jgi:hypothetical protein
MGTCDAQNLKSDAEILARESRPRRNSSWIPKTRDWRYASGVIQHDNFEDAPKSRSVWDNLDYDYQASGDRRSQADRRSESGLGSDVGIIDTSEVVPTPKRAVSKASTGSPLSVVKTSTAYKPIKLLIGAWGQHKRLARNQTAEEDDGDPAFETTGIVVRLRFTGKNKALVKEILGQPAKSPTPRNVLQNMTPPTSSPNTPATARTAETVRGPHILDSIESLHTFPLFKRTWFDETYDFNIATVLTKIRPADRVSEELSANYHWYDDAVPADAIFPPGVPISAKEISAFYPHHVRWKGVMVRLTNNDYRGADILGMQAVFRGAPTHPMTAADMNNHQRDTVKTIILGFKTSSHKGKSDRNLRTDHFVSSPHIKSMKKGYTLPTFEDLVRGLQRLPSGLDARGLSQCVSWYLNICDSFSPKLELNVLHTQSLIRALREPLKPFGPQNLDRNALEEWRRKGTFETTQIGDKKRHSVPVAARTEKPGRSRLHLNLDEDDVSLEVNFPIRHIFTFPFMALHGVVGEALKLGIEKAEMRQASQKEDTVKQALEARWAAQAAEKDDEDMEDAKVKAEMLMQTVVEEPRQSDRNPKRPLPFDASMLSAHKRINIPTGPRVPTGPRMLAPAPSRHAGYLSHSWNSTAPTPTHTPQQQPQGDVYGRRDIPGWQPNQGDWGTSQSGSTNGRGGPYKPGHNNYHNGTYDRC